MNNNSIKDIHRVSILVDCLMHCWYDDVPNDKSNSPTLQSPKANSSAILTTILNSICRTVESYVVEATLEYSRILFDLFYETTSVSVFTTYKEFSRFNSREIQQQSLKLLGENFARLNFKDSIDNNKQDENDGDQENKYFIDYLQDTILSHYEIARAATNSSSNNNETNETNEIKIKSINSNQDQEQEKQKKNIIVIMVQSQEGIDLLKYKSNNKVIDIGKEADQIIDSLKKSQQQQTQSPIIEKKFELVILKIINHSQETFNNNQRETFVYKQYSNNLDCIVKEIDITSLFNAVSDLSVVQFNLSSVLVTGIPMKESSQGSTRAIYDVALLYPSHSSVNNSYNNHIFKNNRDNNNNNNNNNSNLKFILKENENEKNQSNQNYFKNYYEKISTLATRLENEVTVKWKSNDKKINSETLPCTCSHRVTPYLVSSNPTNCLLKHICSGKSVFLVTPPADDVFTHVLTLHDKEVFMHCLHRPINIDRLAPILEHYSNDVSKYRIRDFNELIDNSILLSKQQLPQSSEVIPIEKEFYQNVSIVNPFYEAPKDPSIKPTTTDEITSSKQTINIVSPTIVEKYTRFFPWIENETLFFSNENEELKKVLNPIKKLILRDNLPGESLELISKHIQQLYSHTQSNDSSLFPHLKSSLAIRKENYRKVWLEFYNFSKACQVSQSHIDLHNAIEKIVIQMQIIQQPTPQQQSTTTQPPQAYSIFKQLQLQQQQQKQQQILQSNQSTNQSQPSSSSNIQNYQQKSKNTTQTGSLYQNLQTTNSSTPTKSTGGGGNSDDTLWKNMKLSKKQIEMDELKAANPTWPAGTSSGNDFNEKKRKQSDSPSSSTPINNTATPKNNNFFNSYWEKKQNNIQPQELSGRPNNF